MKTNIKKQVINQINSFIKSILVLSMVMALSLANVSCQKDSDKQDGLKKPNKIEYEKGGKDQKDVNPTPPSKPVEQLLSEKMDEVINIIGDDYTIYVASDSKEEVVTFLFNKKDGFFQSISSDYLLEKAKDGVEYPNVLKIYNNKKIYKNCINKKNINIFNKNEKFRDKIIEAFLKIDTKKEIQKI